MLGGLRNWMFDRSGMSPETIRLWNRPLPKGVGWLSTLGPVALALLALQAITGIFLAMHYSPHPDGAYESTQYLRSLPMGKLIHSLHYYGDSALIIVVLAHLIHTYVIGAYKKPRELTWLFGIVLLQLVLAFGFTGYILPWDMKSFYATQVRTSIAHGIPFIGPYASTLIKGGQEVGAQTLTRLYAIHALLLPGILLPFLLGHWTLAWRKGSTKPGARVGEDEGPVASRYLDNQVFKIAIASLVVLGIVYAFSALAPAPLEFKANPSDATYHPRPEWYFLWLFQLVSDWANIPGLGALSWIPILVIPGAGMTWLALAPWIDPGPERRPTRRPVMIAMLLTGLLVAFLFTMRAYSLLHPNATPENSLYAVYTEKGERPLEEAQVEQGRKAFGMCQGCHVAYGDYTVGKSGPGLTGYGLTTFLAEVKGHPDVLKKSFHQRYTEYVRGTLRPPDSKMPLYSKEMLSDADLEAIGAYLSQDPAKPIVRHQDPAHPKP